MKFGGTSVANAERIKRAASRIVAQRDGGKRVVAVLSARGQTTDELIAMAEEVSPHPDRREMDMLLSTGERISCALCAMAINDLGHRAISLTGSQAGIVTDTSHTKARILDVRADRIREALDEDRIVLVAGFQGVSTSRDVTTLGRGGSDTTAVAVAAALGAEVCEIYTDVAGVFTADPRIVPDARKLPFVSFEEMLEMASSGAKVLQLRSVEYARNHGVRIHCRSSFDPGPGTFVLGEDETMERPLVTAVTHATDEARITLLGVPDRPGAAAAIFGALADAGCNIDTIIQNEPLGKGRDAEVSFTVPADDLADAERALEPVIKQLEIARVDTVRRIGKVSIVGAGMRSHPGVAAKVFQTLAGEEINIEMISTSPIKISCVIRADDVEPAVRALHAAFELGDGEVERRRRRPAMNARPRVAVVGATGVVGTTMLEVLRDRDFPASEIVPFASERSAGRGARRGPRRSRPERGRRPERLRSGDLLRGRGAVAGIWPPVRRSRSRRHRQLLRVSPRPGDPAGGLGGQPARVGAPQRTDREPELLDDGADGRDRPDPPRGRDRAARRVDVPVRVRDRAGRRSTSSTDRPTHRCMAFRCRRPRSIPSRSDST